jgi:sirohydrochlorin ferrochelatase
MTTGFVVFAHGSSVESANEAVRTVAADLARRGGFEAVEPAFLEGGKPDLSEAIGKLAGRVERVVVVPYFLTLGLHLQRDLPRLIDTVRARYPDVVIDVTEPLDGHPGMIEALLDRARTAVG